MLLRDNIYEAIRRSVLNCELLPGQDLREQVLAEQYHVSRSPVRDSLLRLAHEQLVMVLPRQGYRVKPISVADVEDILGLYLVIEPACAAAAAKRADDRELGELNRFRGFAHEHQMESGFLEYNKAFHRAIATLAGNARMTDVAIDLMDLLDRLILVTLQTFAHDGVRESCAEHEAIIDSLQARDPDRASQLSYEHLSKRRACVVAALRPSIQRGDSPTALPAIVA